MPIGTKASCIEPSLLLSVPLLSFSSLSTDRHSFQSCFWSSVHLLHGSRFQHWTIVKIRMVIGMARWTQSSCHARARRATARAPERCKYSQTSVSFVFFHFLYVCGNQTARHKTTTFRYDHVYDNTSTRAAYVRAGALLPPPPCLGGGITQVGPRQYPQYTRAWFAREAVGSSLHRDHKTTATPPTTSPTVSRDAEVPHCYFFLFFV